MTLPELLISVAITGLIMSTLAMATTVILRQSDNSEGRANNARSEQNINLWMPTDLASAETVNKLPSVKPCGTNAPTGPALPACPAGAEVRGSNALMLIWHGRQYVGAPTNRIVDTVTTVSYRVIREATGEFRLYRVQCVSVDNATAVCSSVVVLRELDAPPATIDWIDGVTIPNWVITVTDALMADDISGADDDVTLLDPSYKNKGAQRLVVTINGGGDVAGAGGGQNQISLSAGGTNREIGLTTSDLSGTPNFNAARSRCGGNFGLVVDKSGSISQTEMNSIKGGIRQFINTFAGTPIKVQVVTFSDTATTLGATTWGKYFNMLDDADVTTLRNLVGDPAVNSSGIQRGGSTNWEDGLFRMLRNSDGTIQSMLPGTLIFFTDGMPTKSRLDATSASAPHISDPLDDGYTPGSGEFSQVAWNRAERIIRDRGAINMVGVYVDNDMNLTSHPPVIPDALWMIRGEGYDYEQGNNVVFEQAGTGYEKNNNLVYQISGTSMKYEKYQGGVWVSANPSYTNTSTQARTAFLAGNTTPDSSDNFRVTVTGSTGSWVTITAAQYNASNTTSASTDGFRTTITTLSSTWTATTQALYNLSNTTTSTSDGWRTVTTWSPVTEAVYTAGNVNNGTSDNFRTSVSGSATAWTTITAAKYTLSNTTTDSTDGFRSSYHAAQEVPIHSYATIGNLIAGNKSGVEGGFVEALPRGGPYLDAAAADLFVLPNYTNFASALASVALDQCGGTVTLQTKVGTTSALDPFTYQNLTTNETVQTSAAYRSGTFDVALPGGGSQVVTISPQEFTNLTAYTPTGWSCKAGGVAYPFTTAPVPDHAPWTSITLTVEPNKAVSCVQTVTNV